MNLMLRKSCYYEVNSSECYEKYALKPLSLEDLQTCINQEVEIGIYISSCRVELRSNLKKRSEESKKLNWKVLGSNNP